MPSNRVDSVGLTAKQKSHRANPKTDHTCHPLVIGSLAKLHRRTFACHWLSPAGVRNEVVVVNRFSANLTRCRKIPKSTAINDGGNGHHQQTRGSASWQCVRYKES